MAITTTFGQIETRMRRDLLVDKIPGAYGYSTSAVLSCINDVVVELVTKINSWAGYNQDTGRRIYDVHTREIEEACLPGTPHTAEVLDSDPARVQQLRDLIVPIDDTYVDAIAYLASAKVLESEGFSDVVGAKINMYKKQGMELATR